MNEKIKLLEKKLKKLYSMRPFSGNEMKKIREIFRLEYNYNSNHIEGNSLTMQETRSLLFLEIDSSNTKAITEKRKRDEKEMIWHDQAVQQLWLLDKLDFAEVEIKSDFKISHKLIKELNKIILVEDYKKRVIDENWDQFFVDVIVWQYKAKNNHVKRRDGSIFNFSEYTETHALMQDLIDWFENNKNKLHPIILATMFHYKFIRIHPFDDGNGRVCRLLVNMILMNAGYPLFIVPSSQKEEYYDLLEYMDWKYKDIYEAIKDYTIKNYEPFIGYFANRVWWSIDKMIWVRKRKQLRKMIYGSVFILTLLWLFFTFNNFEKQNTIKNNINVVDTWEETKLHNNWNFILASWSCNFIETWSYKYIDFYDWEFKTPIQNPSIDQYTKEINISWDIEEVKICILADVRDDVKKDGLFFEIKAYLWSDNNAGFLNVWRSPRTKKLYDKDLWSNNPELDGIFKWSETPFKKVIDLERVIIADVWWDEEYKYIRPIVNFQTKWTIKVWAYVEWDNYRRGWEILQFRIIYKWDWDITLN
jgi:Fic family protein